MLNLTDSSEKRYKIKILLSQTTLLSTRDPVVRGKIFFSPKDFSHVFILGGKYIYTRDEGMLIKIHQN